jgi:hypothetical protein
MVSESKYNLQAILKSQYRAAIGMLRQAVERCPDELWLSGEHPNAFWHVAYHAVFVTYVYLQPDFDSFRPWQNHREGTQFLGPIPGNPQLRPKTDEPYSKAQTLEFLGLCDAAIEDAVDKLDLGAPESGFPWYAMSKLEHQFVNIRHLQHHTAQLADRLRRAAGVGVDWVGGKSTSLPG